MTADAVVQSEKCKVNENFRADGSEIFIFIEKNSGKVFMKFMLAYGKTRRLNIAGALRSARRSLGLIQKLQLLLTSWTELILPEWRSVLRSVTPRAHSGARFLFGFEGICINSFD